MKKHPFRHGTNECRELLPQSRVVGKCPGSLMMLSVNWRKNEGARNMEYPDFAHGAHRDLYDGGQTG